MFTRQLKLVHYLCWADKFTTTVMGGTSFAYEENIPVDTAFVHPLNVSTYKNVDNNLQANIKWQYLLVARKWNNER